MSHRIDLADDDAGRVSALGVYVLYALAPFTAGLAALGGVFWAFSARPGAAGPPREHLSHQVGVFWVGLAWAIPIAVMAFVGNLLKIILIGFPIAGLAWLFGLVLAVWWLWKTIVGALRLTSGRPPKG